MNSIRQNNKYYETGSNPYHLNLNNTAKEYSTAQDSTNPQDSYLDMLSRYVFIQNDIVFFSSKHTT